MIRSRRPLEAERELRNELNIADEEGRSCASQLEEAAKISGAHALSLKAELDRVKAKLKCNELDITDLEFERHRLETAVTGMRQQLVDATVELEDAHRVKEELILCQEQLQLCQAQLQVSEIRLKKVTTRLIQREGRLARTHLSRSWRLTAPLRRLHSWIAGGIPIGTVTDVTFVINPEAMPWLENNVDKVEKALARIKGLPEDLIVKKSPSA